MIRKRFRFGRFVFDAGRATLLCDGAPITVGQRGLTILQELLKAHGHVVVKAELLDAAWPGIVIEESNLSVQIAALRKLLGKAADGTDWIITVPRVGYHFNPLVTVDEDTTPPMDSLEVNAISRKPSIAVLPFANLGDDREQEYFADGITEDIINALTGFRWFFVVARHSSFAFRGSAVDIREIGRQLEVNYVLTGSVRKSGSKLRVTAQLINAQTAHQMWANRYDVELGDVFAVQDQITEQVAGAIEPELLKSEAFIASRRRYAGDANAADTVYQGAWLFHQVSRGSHLRARELFRKACTIDRDLPEANLWLARVNAGLVAYGWSDDVHNDLLEGIDAAMKAVQTDERNPYAHYGLAISSLYAGLLEQAMLAAEKSLELGSSFALGHLVLGMARLSSGAASEAIEPLEHGLALNPYDPQNFVWYNALALAHFFATDASKARDIALKAFKVRPVWRPTLETLACCYARLGDLRAAEGCVVQLVTLDTAPRHVFGPLRHRNPQWAEELDGLLQKAKLAEHSRGG